MQFSNQNYINALIAYVWSKSSGIQRLIDNRLFCNRNPMRLHIFTQPDVSSAGSGDLDHDLRPLVKYNNERQAQAY